MNHTKDFNAILVGAVENEHRLKPRDSEDSQRYYASGVKRTGRCLLQLELALVEVFHNPEVAL